jgi:hypothetical protein
MNEIIKPSKYFLGDPSLVLPSKILIGIWENVYNLRNGKFSIYNTDFIVHNTYNGDGKYVDTKNREYIINSGVIGLINVDLIENINLCNNIGHIFEFKNNVNFIYNKGIFIIKSHKKYIKIDTINTDEYNTDEDDVIFNDEGEPIDFSIFNESDDDSIYDENDNIFEDECNKEIDNLVSEDNKKFKFFK